MLWDCPVCDAATRRVFAVRSGYHIRECLRCTHRFAELEPSASHVASTYGDDYFFGGGAGYPDYMQEENVLRAHGRRYGRLLAQFIPGDRARILDVGGACGFIADGFRAEGWSPQLLEPNARMAAYGRDRLGLETHNGTLADLNPESPFDAISMIQVIAHLPEIRVTLRKAAELTRDGGLWLIETWNSRSVTARVFGKYWHEYNPPSVLHFFSARSLREMLRQFGFVHLASGHPRKNIQWHHARALLTHQVPTRWMESLTGIIPDDAVLPYPAEDLMWSVFQKTSSDAPASSARHKIEGALR